MKFDLDIGDEIAEKLGSIFTALPKGKTWIKYGKNRIYFNEKRDGIDYGFFIQFKADSLDLVNFLEEEWLGKLELQSKEEFIDHIEEIYFETAYPLKSRFPATTVRDVRNTRRFEVTILDETDSMYKLDPLQFDFEFELSKDHIQKIRTTPRKRGGKIIHRLVLKREELENVTANMTRIEDEADRLLIDTMTQSLGSIRVGSDEDKSKEIQIEDEK